MHTLHAPVAVNEEVIRQRWQLLHGECHGRQRGLQDVDSVDDVAFYDRAACAHSRADQEQGVCSGGGKT